MDELFSSLLGVLPVCLLVLGNGLFVAVETSLVRSHSTKLRASELKEAYGIDSAIALLENLERSISTTQLGITILSLTLGWYGEGIFHRVFAGMFAFIKDPRLAEIFSHSVATVCALGAVTYLHVVVGELVAKSIAIRYPETTLRLLAPLLSFLTKLFRPVVFVLNGSANLFLALFGMTTPAGAERVHSAGELAMMISHSQEQGVLDEDEEQMLQGIFGFSETVAREVMTPRTDLITISKDASLHDIVATVSRSGFSRFPVIDHTIDNIVGILLSRELIPVIEQCSQGTGKKFDVTTIMREPYFIPGTKSINELLKEFKLRKLHMAIVLDEHGGVDGAVTLEDLIEEIVGEIYDESDDVESDIVVEDSGDIILDGGVLVDEVNERFDLDIPEGDYDTIAGFVMSSLGRVPQPGDQVRISKSGLPLVDGSYSGDPSNGNGNHDTSSPAELGDAEGLSEEDLQEAKAVFIVEKVSGNRIESVRVQQVKAEEPAPHPTPLSPT